MEKDAIPDQVWELMKEHLGYNDEEIELFKKNPRNSKVMKKALDMREKTIVFEVIESHGCNSHHNAGTRFFFSGDGNLLSRMAPSRICAYAMPVMSQAIYGIQELWYAGVDPNELCFKRAGCFDVGIRCGGWGHIVMEAKIMDRKKARELYEPDK
ncbi:MAG: hypothetical protein ABIJ56_22710 [Pseudomonadota bacterium]